MEEDFTGFQEEDDFIQVSQRKNAKCKSTLITPQKAPTQKPQQPREKTMGKHREINNWKLKLDD